MCGIICGNKSVSDNKIISALNLLSDRGPDSRNYVKIDNVFLGHTLLSISSPSLVSQPLWSNDKSLVGCVNGEIYNYKILRYLLETRGYTFETDSDSEVIIHGIHWRGKDFIKYINGEFCFVVYNTISKTWICATDSFGTKPLRYYISEKQFLISSTIKALSAFDIDLQIDKKSCMFCLSSQCLPNGKTLFSNVYTIPPCHILTVDSSLNTSIEAYKIKTDRIHEHIEGIEYFLESSILKRVPKYQNLAVVLSSGIDSSSIAYYLKKNNVKFGCFSIDFPGSEYSESKDINNFCNLHGISTTFVDVSDRDLISYFPTVVLNSENLSINPHAVGKYLVNREMIKQGYKVCMTGDGADELFYGYSHFHTDNDYQFIIDSSRTGKEVFDLLSDDIKEIFDLECILKESNGSSRDLYYKYWLSEYGLKLLGDSQSASLGQEHRYPYLDKNLVNYVNSIENLESANYPSKSVLRNIVRKWNPILADIPKRPFTSPKINSEWIYLFHQYIFENDKLHNLGIFKKGKLIEYINRILTDLPPNRILLTQILSLGILVDKFNE